MPGQNGGRWWCQPRWSCTTRWGDWWDSTPRPLLCPLAPTEPYGAPVLSRLCPATVRRNKHACLALVRACNFKNIGKADIIVLQNISNGWVYKNSFIPEIVIYFERSHYILMTNHSIKEFIILRVFLLNFWNLGTPIGRLLPFFPGTTVQSLISEPRSLRITNLSIYIGNSAQLNSRRRSWHMIRCSVQAVAERLVTMADDKTTLDTITV